jgi:DNA-directed RNA polymerase beta subunit
VLQIERDQLTSNLHELAYNGETGYPMMGLFQGPYPFMMLPKVATDIFKSHSNGPLHVQTRQPAHTTDGKGATRTGKQENNAFDVAGAMSVLQSLTRDQSDLHVSYICSKCNGALFYDQRKKIGVCPNCKEFNNCQLSTVYVHEFVTRMLQIPNFQRNVVLEADESDSKETFLR